MKRIGNYLEVVFANLSALMILLATAFCFGEVVSRYVFHTSHPWIEELVKFLVIYGVFLMAGPGLRRNVHVRVTLLVERLSLRNRRAVAIAANALGALFSLVLGVAGYLFTVHTWALRTTTISALRLPLWMLYGVVPLGMVLLAFFFIENAWREAKGAAS